MPQQLALLKLFDNVQGIQIIAASSPQAKGRVERNHGTHQDRLIKKMRRKQIASYQAANQYLEQEYLPQHNRRFARQPAQAEDYHGRQPTARQLQEIFRLETERTISNDWVIRHEGRCMQLHPRQHRYGPTQSKALICEWEQGTIQVYYRGERIAFSEIKEPMQKAVAARRPAIRATVKNRPARPHPWRQGYQTMKPWPAKPTLAAPLVGMRPSASP